MKKKIHVLILLTTLFCAACDKWLTVQPETTMAAETLFQTETGITQGLNGVYYVIRGSYGPTSNLGGSGTLECLANTYYFDPLSASDGYFFSVHSYEQSDSQDEVLESIFTNLYNGIANLNSLLNEMVKNVADLDPETYKIVRGEAYALRALCHLDVLRIWGPVPSEAEAARTYVPYVRENDVNVYPYHTFEQFMDYVQADLDSAEMFLETVEPVLTQTFAETESTSNTWPYRKSRCNYYAVLALQARAALWRGDNERALRYAKMVIDAKNEDGTSKFRLTTPADDLDNSTETDHSHYSEHIFGLKRYDCDPSNYNWPWSYKRGIGYSTKSLSDYVVELYGENYSTDLRYTNFWKGADGSWVDGPDGSLVYQYSSFTIARYNDFSTSLETAKNNFPIIRLPEMYFIVMECGTLAEANARYEEYCEARNIAFEPLTEADRKERVMLESLREYVAEGQNFYTYKRNNASHILGCPVTWEAQNYILALPEAEVNEE